MAKTSKKVAVSREEQIYRNQKERERVYHLDDTIQKLAGFCPKTRNVTRASREDVLSQLYDYLYKTIPNADRILRKDNNLRIRRTRRVRGKYVTCWVKCGLLEKGFAADIKKEEISIKQEVGELMEVDEVEEEEEQEDHNVEPNFQNNDVELLAQNYFEQMELGDEVNNEHDMSVAQQDAVDDPFVGHNSGIYPLLGSVNNNYNPTFNLPQLNEVRGVLQYNYWNI